MISRAPRDVARSEPPPLELDGYRILREIGRGGMGRVYHAHDALLERDVAIKVLLREPDREETARFLDEARAIARLQHPNVVAIYRVGTRDGSPYLVSELVRGETLDRLPVPIGWTRALAIGMEIARGLAAAHRRGVVHRDIKPANVILSDDGEVKILDFGIARLVDRVRSAPLETSSTSPRVVASEEGDAEAPTSAIAASPEANDDDAPPSSALRPLTRSGTIAGTPQYIAPEVWRGAAATFRSDVYALGVLLFWLTTGRLPHRARTIAEIRAAAVSTNAPSLRAVAPDIDARFAAVIDRCLRLDPAERFASGNEVRAALAQLTPEARAGAVPEGNPYRGLAAFDEAHRALYFGRDSEIRNILDRLAAGGIVLVAGDSGVGKSSLCRAGVLPRVGEWLARSSEGARTFDSLALSPGRHPTHALAAALAPRLGLDESAALALVTDDPSGLARALRGTLGEREGLVLFIDQLEEIVTLADPAESALFADAIAWLGAPSPSVRVLATVRGDFLSGVAAIPAIGEAAQRGLYFLRPLSVERLREAIVSPAAAKDVTFESEAMIDELVASTSQGGGLPLLQFALAELWDARDAARGVIPRAALDALGGVAGALTKQADAVLATLAPAAIDAARGILTALVSPSGTRTRKTEASLALEVEDRRALEALVGGRLIVASDALGERTYEIAHEALISGWRTLARWLADDAEQEHARERLASAAREWRRLGQLDDALWGRRQLVEIEALAPSLDPDERAFVAACRARARSVRARRFAAIAAAPIAALVAWGAFTSHARSATNARVAASIIEADLHLADGERDEALANDKEREAFAAFDAGTREVGEARWSEARASADRATPAFTEADRAIERALLFDPTRADVRARLADLLFERAAIAEHRRRFAERDELLARLGVYDEDGSRRARWTARATLVIEAPRDAHLTIAHVENADGRRLLAEERPLAPVAEVEPGDYVVLARFDGATEVRVPLVVARGESLRLSIAPPPPAPPDFVFIPAGRFLFGSGAEDSLRKGFFNHAPLHPRDASAFFIAKHETTFGEYLAFLRALDGKERASHVPRVDKGGFEGALAVTVDAASATIVVTPSATRYSAREGEPLVYASRDRRRAVDWSKLPVSGVTASDAEAYARWLDASGEVAGARLCTELEWERAARGADDRDYPSGDDLAPDDADIDATYDKSPLGLGADEVGAHPASQSVFGVDDLAGNVWEWTVSSLAPNERVARGGSFYFDANTARISNRQVTEASFRDVSVGFRICATAPRR